MNYSKHSLLCRYRYDPLDRLISHVQSTAAERYRFYCKSRLATEIQETIGYSIVQHGDLLLAQQQRENNALNTTLLATDLQRSVLHTLKKNTERQPISYSAYGHRRAESGLNSLLGFNGERPDSMTGHYLLGNGYRTFNPVLMRFNSPDSWSPFGKGGLNAYAYCLGDPINSGDKSGHTPLAFMGLFGKIAQMPDVLDNIFHRLLGVDMVSVARTSSEMKNVVYASTRKLPEDFSNIKGIKITDNSISFHKIDPSQHLFFAPKFVYQGNIQAIGSGLAPGVLPVQLSRSGVNVSISGDSIDSGLKMTAKRLNHYQPGNTRAVQINEYRDLQQFTSPAKKNRGWTIRSST